MTFLQKRKLFQKPYLLCAPTKLKWLIINSITHQLLEISNKKKVKVIQIKTNKLLQ